MHHHQHFTLACPVCEVTDGAVARMSDKSWHCFRCRSHGHFAIDMSVHHVGSSVTSPVPATDIQPKPDEH